jgi:hypothetical protein
MAQLVGRHSDSQISTGKALISVDRDSLMRGSKGTEEGSAREGRISCRRRCLDREPA